MALRPELSSMDKDTILFIRKNRIGLAYHWDFYKKNKSLISKKFLNNPPVKVLYKVGTGNGPANWVDFDLAVQAGRYNGSSAVYTVDKFTHENIVTRDYDQVCCDKAFEAGNYLVTQMGIHIPCSKYVDSEGFEYSIGLNDGVESYVLHKRMNAGGTDDKSIIISQGSMENKSLDFKYRHLMEDLRLDFKDDSFKNTLVSLNSQMVPLASDNTNSHVGWIRGGLNLVSHMNNSFTRIARRVISDPMIMTSEPTKSNILFDGYFFSNKKDVLFGVSKSGDLYRCTNINNMSWIKCTNPKLYVKDDKDISTNTIFIPIIDRSKLTNKIVAFDFTADVDGAERSYAVSEDNGVTWTKYAHQEKFGNNSRVIPVFFPDSDGVYIVSEFDNMVSIKESLTCEEWDTLSYGNRNGFIKIENLSSSSDTILGKYFGVNDLSWNSISKYVYKLMRAGHFLDYTPNVFVAGNTLFIKNDSNEWCPLLLGKESFELIYGEEVANSGLEKTCDISKLVEFINLEETETAGKVTGVYGFIDSWDGGTSLEKKLKLFSGFEKTDEFKRVSSYTEFKIEEIIPEEGLYSGDKVYVVKPIVVTGSTNVKLHHVKQIWEDDGIDGHENNPQITFGQFINYNEMNVAVINRKDRIRNGVEGGLYSQNALAYVSNENLKPDQIRSIKNTLNTTVDWKAVVSAKLETVVGQNDSLRGDFEYTDILWDGNKSILFLGNSYVDTSTIHESSSLSDTPQESFGYYYRLIAKNRYHYGIRVKAYRWNGVNMTQMIKARYITDPNSEVNVSSSERIPTKIGFPININPHAFLLMYNGMPIIDDSVYVNPDNPKEIICENLYRYKIMQGYINPIQFKKDKRDWVYNDFSVISFTAEDSSKDCFMFLDKGISTYLGKRCMVDFHSNIAGDLILFNGIDHEYIIHPRTKRRITYVMSRYGLQEAVYSNSPYNHIGTYNVRSDVPRNIYRIQFCLKDKL